MKLFNEQTLPLASKESMNSHSRVDLYEREAEAEEKQISLADRYVGDKRIKQYGNPSFDQSKIRRRIEHKKAKEQAEKLVIEQKAAAKIEAKRAEMIKAGKSEEEINEISNKAVKRAENLAQTGEQLKSVLSMGAFKFSDKERAVLNKILKK